MSPNRDGGYAFEYAAPSCGSRSERAGSGDPELRYGILSDIHANIEALEAVLEKIEDLAVDQHRVGDQVPHLAFAVTAFIARAVDRRDGGRI